MRAVKPSFYTHTYTCIHIHTGGGREGRGHVRDVSTPTVHCVGTVRSRAEEERETPFSHISHSFHYSAIHTHISIKYVVLIIIKEDDA